MSLRKTLNLRKRVNKILRFFNYEIVRRSKFSFILDRYLENSKDFYFVQIGAHDGIRFDSLYMQIISHAAKVKGLVVEPVKDYFDVLTAAYRQYPNIKPVNVAIHKDQASITLYKVDPAKVHELPEWAAATASVIAEQPERNNIPAEFIVTEVAEAMPLMKLFENYGVEHIDLLQIDVEGYDAEIIKMLDFSKIKPKLIKYEHKYFDTQQRQELTDLLSRNGYRCFTERADTICILK